MADSKIQAEFTIEAGQAIATLQSLLNQMSKFGQGVGAATAPANQAIGSLSQKISDYKAAQVSQARTANYFVTELTEVTGLSREAAGAVRGLGQVLLEAAAGGSAFAVGFEVAKLAASQAIAEWKRSEEQLKLMMAVQVAATAAIMEGKYALDKLTATKDTAGTKAFKETFDAATKGAKDVTAELEKMREKGPGVVAWIRAAFGDGGGLSQFEDGIRRSAGELDRLIASAKEYAAYARDVMGGWEESPEQSKRYWDIKADDAKRNREAILEVESRSAKLMGDQQTLAVAHGQAVKKIKDDLALTWEIRTRMLGVEEREYALAVQLSQIKRMPAAVEFTGFEDGARLDPAGAMQAEADRHRREAESARIAEETRQDETSGAFSGYETPGGLGMEAAQAALAAQKDLNTEAMKTTVLFTAIGDAVGGAFSAIGTAIGGMTGSLISQIAAVVMLTVKFIGLAIAASMASAAQTPIVGPWAAIAGGIAVAAAVASLIASIASYEVGTSYVPRTGLAMIHQGEAIIPASQNRGGVGASIVVNVSTPDAQSFERMLRRNDSALVRVLREASASGRL
jgi:hypothetical protein